MINNIVGTFGADSSSSSSYAPIIVSMYEIQLLSKTELGALLRKLHQSQNNLINDMLCYPEVGLDNKVEMVKAFLGT